MTKVKYIRTHLLDDEIVFRIEGTVPKDFDDIFEATKWINRWLDDKESLARDLGFECERKGNVLRWSAMGVTLVEVLDVF